MAILNLYSEKVEIRKRAAALVKQVKDYSNGQKELWRLVPGFSLAAGGVYDYSTSRKSAYVNRLFPLLLDDSEHYIDLKYGNIIKLYSAPPLNGFLAEWDFIGGKTQSEAVFDIDNRETLKLWRLADDETVLRLAHHIKLIDANSILQSLAAGALQTDPGFFDANEQIPKRTFEAQQFGIVLPTLKELEFYAG